LRFKNNLVAKYRAMYVNRSVFEEGTFDPHHINPRHPLSTLPEAVGYRNERGDALYGHCENNGTHRTVTARTTTHVVTVSATVRVVSSAREQDAGERDVKEGPGTQRPVFDIVVHHA
jgi:hypothetical protein